MLMESVMSIVWSVTAVNLAGAGVPTCTVLYCTVLYYTVISIRLNFDGECDEYVWSVTAVNPAGAGRQPVLYSTVI